MTVDPTIVVGGTGFFHWAGVAAALSRSKSARTIIRAVIQTIRKPGTF